jgi:hypothetical protein
LNRINQDGLTTGGGLGEVRSPPSPHLSFVITT